MIDIHTRIWDSMDVLGRGAQWLHRQRDVPWERIDASSSAHAAAMAPVKRVIVHGYESRHLGASIDAEAVARYVEADPAKRLGFASIDPTDANPIRKLERARSLGMVGVTVNPATQNFHPSDSRAMALYEACQDQAMPVFFDAAHMLARDARLEFVQPYLLDEVAREFSDLKMVISGLGYPWISQGIALIGKHPTIFADLSGLTNHPWQVYNALLLAFQQGVMGQILFGSDFPFSTPEKAIATIYSTNTLTQGTHLPSVPREQLRAMVERDALSCLGLAPSAASSSVASSPREASASGEMNSAQDTSNPDVDDHDQADHASASQAEADGASSESSVVEEHAR